MGERVVLTYGDSNTHGTVPMATLEDMRALRAGRALAGGAGGRARAPAGGWSRRGCRGGRRCYPDPIAGVHKNGLGAAAGGAREPPADRPRWC